MENAFKNFRESNSLGDLIPLVNKLFPAGRAPQAVDLIRHWLKTAPVHEAHPDDVCCLAQRLCFLGEPEEGLALFEQLIDPDLPRYQNWLTEMAWAHFLLDDFATGRAVWQRAAHHELAHNYLRVHGAADCWFDLPSERYMDTQTDVRGKIIWLINDGGIGDQLQNFRYLNALLDEGPAKVYFAVLGPLKRLVESNNLPIINSVVSPPEAADCDYIGFPQSLFLRYEDGSGKQTQFPYLHPSPASERIAPTLETIRQRKGKPKVAIFWRSTNANRCEPYRSLKITELQSLFELPNVAFFSCLTGNLSEEEKLYLERYQVPDLGANIGDMDDLASILKEMDLVISIDSAPVHLAGALSIPVYLLLSTMSEWRWGRRNSTSFLYPSLRLFRQQSLADWQAPLNEIKALLSKAAG